MSGSNTFDDLCAGLNDAQLRAVTAQNVGSILILAGAGCGKTSVLTRRIAHLAKNGVDPKRICALTFSKLAAEEMRLRLAKFDNEKISFSSTHVSTFHAFALHVLKEKINNTTNFERIGFSGNAVLMTSSEHISTLSQIANEPLRNALDMTIYDIEAALNMLSLFPEKAQKKFGAEKILLLKKIETKFLDLRKSQGVWIFNDLINSVITLFKNHKDIGEHYANMFDVILVDEFQDTNPAQIALLELLLKSKATLYAVGDDDQAIYGFQGADVTSILNFETRFKNASIIKLQTNYRSVTPILNFANKLWADKPLAYRKILVSGLSNNIKGCDKPQTIFTKTFEDALARIMKIAKSHEAKEKIKICDMVILFRLNDTLNTARKFYESKNINENNFPQLLTIHASKGLEYPVVFLCDLEEGIFPCYQISKKQKIKTWGGFFKRVFKSLSDDEIEDAKCDFDEERRLFYVAITRAERFLYLFSSRQKTYRDKTETFKHSRLLN